MTEAFRTIEDYELFLYTLIDRFPEVQRSTVVLVRRGSTLARVAGELLLAHNFRLVLRERLLYRRSSVVIDSYGYEIWHGSEKLYWYDSQPHPDDPSLQETQPHHKHIPPNIKQNRIPAPDMSFTKPNIPALIQEIEALIHESSRSE
jgi:hypothetical protein